MKGFLAAMAAATALPALATVNVNTAQQSELRYTRVLDPQAAKAVIVYRNAHGPYRSIDDLANAIGAQAASAVAPQVAFAGPSYVGPPRPARAPARKPGGSMGPRAHT
jgi:competence protein ComEA